MASVFRVKDKAGKPTWFCTGQGLFRLEMYRPYVHRLPDGTKGFKGKSPFEALSRYLKFVRGL